MREVLCRMDQGFGCKLAISALSRFGLRRLGVQLSFSVVFRSAILLFATVGGSFHACAAGIIDLTASWDGAPETVFDADSGRCDKTDIPDQSARAFRDANGQVHLFATHYIARAMVGPDLSAVKHECHVVYRSLEDANPSHFLDRNWLESFYTGDGLRVVALLHSEFEGSLHPGMCIRAIGDHPAPSRCWWTTITMAMSHDGGDNFASPAPPKNLVASLPYQYDRTYTASGYGYEQPTNIIKINDYYYGMILDWPYKSQKYGPCLIRTSDPYDAAAWRAWDGAGFNIRFINPYVERGFHPENHVCIPVGAPSIYSPGSLSVHRSGDFYVTTELAYDHRFGKPGLYIAASSDLIHWSKPSMVASIDGMLQEEPAGRWRYGYAALLDPTAKDRNFMTVSDTPFMYYVRFNSIRGNLSRTLMRRRVRLDLRSATSGQANAYPAPPIGFSPGHYDPEADN